MRLSSWTVTSLGLRAATGAAVPARSKAMAAAVDMRRRAASRGFMGESGAGSRGFRGGDLEAGEDLDEALAE